MIPLGQVDGILGDEVARKLGHGILTAGLDDGDELGEGILTALTGTDLLGGRGHCRGRGRTAVRGI
jgi:hypothetical protein